MNLQDLGCLEHDFIAFTKCLSVCLSVCDTNFVAMLKQKIVHVIALYLVACKTAV